MEDLGLSRLFFEQESDIGDEIEEVDEETQERIREYIRDMIFNPDIIRYDPTSEPPRLINRGYEEFESMTETERERWSNSSISISSNSNNEPNRKSNTATLPFEQEATAPVEDLEELISEMKRDD